MAVATVGPAIIAGTTGGAIGTAAKSVAIADHGTAGAGAVAIVIVTGRSGVVRSALRNSRTRRRFNLKRIRNRTDRLVRV